MSQKLYVGGLSYQTTESELQNLFQEQGEVSSATIIMDRYTGQSKGFGFVEMASSSDASRAIDSLNGKSVGGRNITVNEARDRKAHR